MQTKPIGVILAGGRGRRLGGRDKGLLEINGRKMVDYCVANLRPQVSAIIINANRNLSDYRQIADFVVPDMTKDYPGPLSGILSVLHYWEQNKFPVSGDLVTVPCDMPALPLDLVERLYAYRSSNNADNQRIVVAHDGQRLQPLCALLPFSIKARLEQFLAEGHRKALDWVHYAQALSADFSTNTASFININTQDDVRDIANSTNDYD